MRFGGIWVCLENALILRDCLIRLAALLQQHGKLQSRWFMPRMKPQRGIQLVGGFRRFAQFLPRNADIEMRIRRFGIDRGRSLKGLNRTLVITPAPSCDSQTDQAVGPQPVELNGAIEFRDRRFPITFGEKFPPGLIVNCRLSQRFRRNLRVRIGSANK